MTTRPRPIRVLLVDDDPAFLEALSAAAADRNISIVGTARSGEEALERVDDLQPDVVVLDVLMPGMGGVEAARQCRERHPSCRVILISGSIFQKHTPDPAELGANRFLPKSGVLTRLQPTIIGICQEAAPTHASG
jgi:DNA-binding NarL/FixJ family response regulator